MTISQPRFPGVSILVTASVVLGSLISLGQEPVPGSVGGLVRLADTHAPAEGVSVSLFSSSPTPRPPETGEYVVRDDALELHATVALEGSFTITGVPPGVYSVMVYKAGYIAQDPRISVALPSLRPIQRVTVLPGRRENIEVELERGGSIEGRVTFPDGRPANTGMQASAEVAVNVEVETEPGKFIRYGDASHTDAQGNYSLEGLPPGHYIVFAAFPGDMVTTTRGRMGSSGRPIFAPGFIRASKAQVVEVQESEIRHGIDIQVPMHGLHSVAGKVVDSSGHPMTEGLVRLYPAGEPDLSLSAPPGVHGEFVFADLPDDSYTLRVESYGAIKFLGMTEDKRGMRMLKEKAPFAPVSTDITVSGKNVEALVLKVQ